ncbi:MerC domain-containing protein [Pontiellaceae bacterium B1224]|nr:MerC domain-containing protein [Pontiellaceae bacterium B1224]
MTTQTKVHSPSHGWLDSCAIGMSVICGIHCMVTPVLIAVLPVLASTFWVHKDFHLWMLALVVPMAAFSLFVGCRKHKSKMVMGLGLTGLGCLVSVAVYESFFHAVSGAHCALCAQEEAGSLLNPATLVNLVGAAFLTAAHTRNFLLCRKEKCCD